PATTPARPRCRRLPTWRWLPFPCSPPRRCATAAPTCGFCWSGSNRLNAPARRRRSAAPSKNGCGSPATCTTLSRTASTRTTAKPVVAAPRLDRDPETARTALTMIETASHEALQELRMILGVLRDAGGGTAPLEPVPDLAAIETLIERARSSGLEVS